MLGVSWLANASLVSATVIILMTFSCISVHGSPSVSLFSFCISVYGYFPSYMGTSHWIKYYHLHPQLEVTFLPRYSFQIVILTCLFTHGSKLRWTQLCTGNLEILFKTLNPQIKCCSNKYLDRNDHCYIPSSVSVTVNPLVNA